MLAMRNNKIPRKHIVSARVKDPTEKKGFCHHFGKALKRTFINIIIVAILLVVLFFTDGLWMCEQMPYQITPVNFTHFNFSHYDQPASVESSTLQSTKGTHLGYLRTERLFEGLVSGPESFVFYEDWIITSCADGKVVKLNLKSNEISVLYSRCDTPQSEKECGRPLGLELVGDHTLLFIDSYHGLFEHDLLTNKQSQLFPPPHDPNFNLSSFSFLNSLQVDKDQTTIYFSQSSMNHQRENFIKIVLEFDCSGRIIKLDRKSGEWSVVVEDLCFVNGISNDIIDENYLLANELGKARIIRIDKRTGDYIVFADGLPGFPDNIRADKKGYWIGFPAVRNSFLSELLYTKPFVRSVVRWLNSMELLNPVNLAPAYGLVGFMDHKGAITKLLYDPVGVFSQKITEAAPHNGYLYLGSYHPRFRWIGRHKLSAL